MISDINYFIIKCVYVCIYSNIVKYYYNLK